VHRRRAARGSCEADRPAAGSRTGHADQGRPGRLNQAVGNIISNAIKFTQDGQIDVRLRKKPAGAVIEIVDTGTGIPASEIDHLFVPFFRASTATREAIPGTGLGLSITKEIIEAHGGSISVRSDEGSGTAFRVELPAEPAQ
jgi:signal transduction histidine kinase